MKHSGEPLTPGYNGWPDPLDSVDRQERRTISHKTAMKVFERDFYRCQSCGSPFNLVPDHIIPIHAGGCDDISNLQTLCHACNASKGGKIAWKGRQGFVK